ncbi:MAG: helix-turn-helix transcriptional regulator [Liquorilactobacillus satsumensis]
MVQLTIENARKRIANSQSKMAMLLGMSTTSYRKYENYQLSFRYDKALQFSALTGVPFGSINFLGKSTNSSYNNQSVQVA